MKRSLLIQLLLLLSFGSIGQPVKKVLLIGIDGCRVDALQAAYTPNIDTLIANGIFSPDALNTDVTKSGPGWSAMLTGVWSDKHLVNSNDFSNNNYADYPSIFHHLEAYDSSLNTASIVRWFKINTFIIQNDADYAVNVGTDSAVGLHVAFLLTTFDPDVMFLHFDDTDITGHSSGFSPTNPAYIDKIEKADIYIGNVLNSLKARPSYSNEDWMIMVSTDHGGIGTTHGGTTIEERRIFVIASGENISTKIIRRDSMMIDTTMVYDYSNTPRTVDIPYTIFSHLCIPVDSAWEFAGNSLLPNCPDTCNTPDNPVSQTSGSTSVTVSWEAVAGATGYVVQGGVMASSNYVSLNTPNPNLTVHNLVPSTTYMWQVAAICDNGVTPFTVFESFTLPATCTPPAPIFHSNLDSTSVLLNWTPSPSAAGYLISGRRIGNPNITHISITGGGSNAKQVLGLTPGIVYEWSVKTNCGNNNNSAYAAVGGFTTPGTVLKQREWSNMHADNVIGSTSIYPNPFNQNLFVSLNENLKVEEILFEMYNSNGVCAIKGGKSAKQNEVIRIDTQSLPSGLYHLVIQIGEESIHRRVLLLK